MIKLTLPFVIARRVKIEQMKQKLEEDVRAKTTEIMQLKMQVERLRNSLYPAK